MQKQLLDLIVQPNWKIILYDLVRSNELDLWNINIKELTDLYLEKIKSLKELNLLVPANALLAAAILLKLKANTLKLSSIYEEEDKDILKMPDNAFILNNSMDLENPTRLKDGQVSLDELIDIVDYMMNRPTKKNIERQLRQKKEINFSLPKKTKDINRKIEDLFSILKQEVDSEGCTMFSKFKESVNNKLELIDSYFIPLLFLVRDNRVNIWQDSFFSEIFIKVL